MEIKFINRLSYQEIFDLIKYTTAHRLTKQNYDLELYNDAIVVKHKKGTILTFVITDTRITLYKDGEKVNLFNPKGSPSRLLKSYLMKRFGNKYLNYLVENGVCLDDYPKGPSQGNYTVRWK